MIGGGIHVVVSLTDSTFVSHCSFSSHPQAEIDHVENVAAQYYSKVKDVVLQPGALGGLMGVGESRQLLYTGVLLL